MKEAAKYAKKFDPKEEEQRQLHELQQREQEQQLKRLQQRAMHLERRAYLNQSELFKTVKGPSDLDGQYSASNRYVEAIKAKIDLLNQVSRDDV